MSPAGEVRARLVRAAWTTAWLGLVVGQLHAMARHQTVGGRDDLDSPLVAAWSDPARHAFAPLLGWASPDTVYLTYGKVWLLVEAGRFVAAYVVWRARTEAGAVHGAERWAWRLALPGYALMTLMSGAEYWTQWGAMDATMLDTVFLVSLPVALGEMLASTFLGVVLLRRGLTLTGWVLALGLPLTIAIASVTSIGNSALPAAFVMAALAGRGGARRGRHGEVATEALRV